jgi:hypothetical protein
MVISAVRDHDGAAWVDVTCSACATTIALQLPPAPQHTTLDVVGTITGKVTLETLSQPLHLSVDMLARVLARNRAASAANHAVIDAAIDEALAANRAAIDRLNRLENGGTS